MEIVVDNRYGSTSVVVIAENVRINEDVYETLYGIGEDGKKDYKQNIGRDISDEGLQLLTTPLEDLIYYRERTYDSSTLIRQLFDKLPEEKQQSLLKELVKDYLEDDE